mmetsp:Transcript_11450/g.20231  ORF Transcript_11450/g.20231 Transcript_11450/m.20231 type:complete len:293 (-) Transcript_11450:189-1067(-)
MVALEAEAGRKRSSSERPALRLGRRPHLLSQSSGRQAYYAKQPLEHARKLIAAGFELKQLREAGLQAYILKEAGFDLVQLRNAGYDASQLKRAGFDASQLTAAGFHLWRMMDAGFGAGQLVQAGFAHQSMLDCLADRPITMSRKDSSMIGTSLSGEQVFRIDNAPMEDESLLREILADFLQVMPDQVRILHGLPDGIIQVRNSWLDKVHCSELRTSGFTARQLKESGFSVTKLKEAGFDARQLKEAEYNAEHLKEAGFVANQLKEAEFTAKQLKEARFSAKQLKEAGLMPNC